MCWSRRWRSSAAPPANPAVAAAPLPRLRPTGWWTLGLFWVVVVAASAATVGWLRALGPLPTSSHLVAEAPVVPSASPPTPTASSSPTTPQPTPDGIAAPQAALLEPSKLFPPALLPRVATDGRVSRLVYAAHADPADRRPKVAVVITGLGMSDAESRAAMNALPAPVSLAFSPYAANLDPLLDLSRRTGHEILLSLPLEPQGYPLNDAGSRSLLAGAPPQENAANLEWALGRMGGYVGAIGAMDAMRGERFADLSSSLRAVLDELSRRGLLYVDPRPGKTVDKLADVPGRTVDAVIDDPQARAEIEGKLAGLERLAREKGAAIGFAGPLRPVTVERIAVWAKGLADRGIALVPVSALINPEGST